MEVVRAIRERIYVTGADAAHRAVNAAVARGELPRPCELKCVDCGAQGEHYDHRDYNKPMEVEAVCRSCNFIRGAAKVVDEVAPYVVEAEELPKAMPKSVPVGLVMTCKSYRDACLMAWNMRTRQNMTRSTLAEMTGIFPSHLSDFLSISPVNANGVERRELLAKHIPAFERAVGNTFVSQWLAYQSGLIVVEG